MLQELKEREAAGQPIWVGIVGLGSMGLAIADQLGRTPGMRVSFLADTQQSAADQAARLYGKSAHVTTDALSALRDPGLPCDVLVEATNSILAAYDYCRAAIERRAHCVLVNAEVDLVLGHLLRKEAARHGVVVTSDAGDQHGVLARMIDEIELWGFQILQAGNMKGFLDRHRTLAGSVRIAQTLKLNPLQCLAYTDGSKLNIEMAIVANQTGFTPSQPGMAGPRADRVEDVLNLFDFEACHDTGVVDYVLGARQHGGGVYVVARCDSPLQQFYLNYYKVTNRPPYYLFFRPYHLCHFETTRAIALAVLYSKAVCTMREGRVTDCYAFAKRSLAVGDEIAHAIGSDEIYGLIDNVSVADLRGQVPQGLLSAEGGRPPRIRKPLHKDEPLTWEHIDMPESRLLELWKKQASILSSSQPPV